MQARAWPHRWFWTKHEDNDNDDSMTYVSLDGDCDDHLRTLNSETKEHETTVLEPESDLWACEDQNDTIFLKLENEYLTNEKENDAIFLISKDELQACENENDAMC